MMMAQKPLHELLKEDQEPFLLKNYIADRRCQFKKLKSRTQQNLLQIKKRKPIPQNFCKNACFFSVINSPDLKKSPLFELQSPVKSPRKTTNAIFLHIPAKTAGLLLDAALRIQKQSSACQKPKSNSGFGLFGSLLNRLKKTSPKKEQLSRTSVKDVLKFRDSRKRNNEEEMSSGVWSESNCNEENNSWDLDLETSSSGQLSQEMEFVSNDSPFHFVLKRSSSSSSGHRTPVFLSPATSPCRHKTEVKENNNEVESLEKFQENNEEEEDKEQCSPVSVLDPPFEDDDDGHYDHSEDDGFDLECSYAFVQRAKLQLLQKLRRFEKLAGLDPVELEKRMLEQEHELEEEPDYGDDNDETDLSDGEQDTETLVIEELMSKSSFCHLRKIPKDMKRLVSDLINEEEREQNYFGERETTAKRVCKRFESWKEVESNTIDMMVEEDFKKELDAWKKYQEQVSKAALEIELGILELLVEELSQELVSLA
ncbi:uncharacterized protein LOC126678953 [Mercurialis annua]|uniref:uncharacterized protein LOC126678953 n=1 Tax=Mercurialis annua TaxID=3986 RepID=UPI00215E0184|nr:uncharacterized protein LOC126678953 [Mercurialis annua]